MEESYRNNAGTAIAMLEKTERINIQMATLLSEEQCKLMGATRISWEEVQEAIDEENGSMAIIENASLIYR